MKRSLLVTITLLLAASAAQSQTNLPLLPKTAGYTLKSVNSGTSSKTRINTYTDKKTTYQVNSIDCPSGLKNIGNISFDYAPYTGDFDGEKNGNSFGGAIINGGFILNSAKYKLMPGEKLEWLQYVTVSGSSVAANNKTFIDGSPLYPDFTPTDTHSITSVLFDAPGRGPIGNVGFGYDKLSWKAESALVCWDTKKELDFIGSFTWGFNFTTNAGVTSVTGAYPTAWDTNITKNFKDKFNDAYKSWTLEKASKDDCCFVAVPELGGSVSFVVFCSGFVCCTGFAGLIRRRRLSTEKIGTEVTPEDLGA